MANPANVLNWNATTNSGFIQKESDWGIYHENLTEKPVLDVEYASFQYMVQANVFVVDGAPMTTEQKTLCEDLIAAWDVANEFKAQAEEAYYLDYLRDTDYMFTVDNYDSSSEEDKAAYKAARAQCRSQINTIRQKYGIGSKRRGSNLNN